MNKSFVVCLLFCACHYFAAAQCPDRTALYHRILFLKDSLKPPPATQLTELQADIEVMQKCRFVDDTIYAFLLRRVGILYFLEKKYTQAVSATRSAIDVLSLRQNQRAGQAASANCYLNLSLYYKAMGMNREKNAARDSCLIKYMSLPDSLDAKVLQVIFERTDDLFNTGDYYSAIYYADMIDIFKVRPSEQSRAVRFTILTDKLNALNFLKQYDRCRQTLAEHESDFMRSGNPNDLGKLYSLKGDIAKGLGEYGEALRNFKMAFSIHSKEKYPQGCTQTLNDIGFLYLSGLHDPAKALTYFRLALGWQDSVESLNIIDNMANAFFQLHKYDSAFYYFQKGLDQFAPGLREKDLVAYPFVENSNITTYLVELLLNKGDACLKTANVRQDKHLLRQAIGIYRTTDKLLDRIRQGQTETGSKLFWRADNHRLYDRAIEACFAADDMESAFYFFEKSRAVLLNDRMLELSQASEHDLLLQAKAQAAVQSLETALSKTDHSSPRYRPLQEDAFKARQQMLVFSGNILRNAPSRLRSEGHVVTDMAEIQKKIGGEGFCLLELFAGDSAIYTLTITSSAARMGMIPKLLYDSLSQVYAAGLANIQPTRASYRQQETIARQLYHLLFPDERLLTARIIISPDGYYFPFESLPVNPEKQPLRYFVEDHSVSYTYSARYLQNSSGDSTSPSTRLNFLGIAPVEYASYQQLPPLKGSDRSLAALRSHFIDGAQMTHSSASLHNFQENFYKYQILQLYTHATNGSVGGHPLIYFADSALSLSALIPEKRPVTRLVVLSACETATGDLRQGEGVFSFSREFAALGIPAAIANLWSVEDHATYQLTELFYKHLSSGVPTDIALQQAKKEFLLLASEEQRLPYYWAGPVLTGRPTVLVHQGAAVSWLIDLLIILAMLMAWYFVQKVWIH